MMSKKHSHRSRSTAKPAVWLGTLGAVLFAVLAGAIWLGQPDEAVADADIVVYKTPSCGCCSLWVDHLRDNGFSVAVKNVRSTRPTQMKYGVPSQMGSCHTAVVGDYWVEGHVPADLIRQLMTDRPADIQGIAVPGMPIGSPGMEGPNPQTYDVVALQTDGQTRVYATRKGREKP